MKTPLDVERRLAEDTAIPEAHSDALLVSRHEAARLLGVGTTTVDEMIRSGALRSVRISRRRLVVRASISEYVLRAAKTP
jgi:excisionase family DNA binding protein